MLLLHGTIGLLVERIWLKNLSATDDLRIGMNLRRPRVVDVVVHMP